MTAAWKMQQPSIIIIGKCLIHNVTLPLIDIQLKSNLTVFQHWNNRCPIIIIQKLFRVVLNGFWMKKKKHCSSHCFKLNILCDECSGLFMEYNICVIKRIGIICLTSIGPCSNIFILYVQNQWHANKGKHNKPFVAVNLELVSETFEFWFLQIHHRTYGILTIFLFIPPNLEPSPTVFFRASLIW